MSRLLTNLYSINRSSQYFFNCDWLIINHRSGAAGKEPNTPCCKNNNNKKKHSIATITQLRSLELLTAKTPLLHMLYYMNWLTHDFWTRTGGWEFDRSHSSGTSSPSHWRQAEEQAPNLWVGWFVSSWWPLFLSRSSVLIHTHINIYICSSLWVLLSLVYQLCLALWY